MPYCEFCGQDAGFMPFKCKYCGGSFCTSHRLPENHECNFSRDHQEERIKEKEKIKSKLVKERDLGVVGMRSTIGTSFLYLIIISLSLLNIFFPEFISLRIYTWINSLYPWTYFTSLFVITITNLGEICYFLVLLFFSYYFIRAFENRYGPNILFFTYVISAGSFLFFTFIFGHFYVYGFALFYVGIGLAPGGLFGLAIILLRDNSKRDWYFMNIKLKAMHVLIILIIASIASKVITSMIIFESIPSSNAFPHNFNSILYYFSDLYGPLVALFFFAIYERKKEGASY